jgi:hypothetical protein
MRSAADKLLSSMLCRPAPTLLIAAALFAWTPGAAQENESPDNNEPRGVDAKYDEQLIDEVIVRGSAWRTPDKTKPEREPRWRTEIPPAEPKKRMTFGYDPSEELELRRENPLYQQPAGGVEPATVFRFRF